jgi:hypothetical protein
MGVASKLLGRAVGLGALGILMLTTATNADPSADSRLIFDPGALDRSQLGSDRQPSQRPATRPSEESPVQSSERVWIPDTFKLPDFRDSSAVSGSVAGGLSSAKNQSPANGGSLFEPRVNFGTLSIGLETETTIKQRSLAGDADKDPQRDTILDDPKRQRGFLPFIGLSAKSTLQ